VSVAVELAIVVPIGGHLSHTQAIQQQCSSETEEGGNAEDGSSEGEEGDFVEEEDDKATLKGDKTGSKRKKTATSKVPHFSRWTGQQEQIILAAWKQL